MQSSPSNRKSPSLHTYYPTYVVATGEKKQYEQSLPSGLHLFSPGSDIILQRHVLHFTTLHGNPANMLNEVQFYFMYEA